ncbi:MAG TPA: DMT family transporter [Bauldia sp.]|nr:DMT family transporter [Bauldia sp.]
MTPFRDNLRGILAISAANLLFLINDTLIKLASPVMPLGEILFIRGLFATILLVPIVMAADVLKFAPMLWNASLAWRTVAEVFAALLFILALFNIPIANINAILQVVPLMVTACAAIFLGEKVGWRRWAAIFVGFLGVLIVIRPGLGGFDAYSFVALGSMVFITLRDLTTRTMPRGIPALLVALVTAVAVCLTGPVFGVLANETWVVPDGAALLLVGGAALFLIGGYLFAVDFMRHGDIAVVAPFRYIVILWAIIVGYLVWREVPDLAMIVGTSLVIASGIYTIHRERRIARIVAESDIDR